MRRFIVLRTASAVRRQQSRHDRSNVQPSRSSVQPSHRTRARRQAEQRPGVQLAEERRPVFKKMIVENPRAALQMAVQMVVRQELPPAIVAKIEQRVNGRGALRVYQGVGADNQSPSLYRVKIYLQC